MKGRNLKTEIKNKILERDKYKCFYCGKPLLKIKSTNGYFQSSDFFGLLNILPFGKATIDHLTPVIFGGTNAQCNLVSSCDNCNQEKGNRPYTASFIGWLQYLTEHKIDKKYLNKKHL